MEDNKINKAKTYLVVMIFILIIVLSAYIVIKKTASRTVDEKVVVKEKILDNSTNKLELSLNNKSVKALYDRINNNMIDYLSYSYINKNLDWDIKSFITVANMDKKLINGNRISSDDFRNEYNKIFVDEENLNLDSEECGRASYDEDAGEYVINEYCTFNKERKYIQAYLKDVIAEDDAVKVRKYYVFIVKDVDGYNLYVDSNTNEDSLIALDVSINEIPSYIDKMNIMTYVFKKDLNNNYYLESIK